MRRPMLLITLAIATLALWLWQSYFIATDTCLDSGGRWNAVTSACQPS